MAATASKTSRKHVWALLETTGRSRGCNSPCEKLSMILLQLRPSEELTTSLPIAKVLGVHELVECVSVSIALGAGDTPFVCVNDPLHRFRTVSKNQKYTLFSSCLFIKPHLYHQMYPQIKCVIHTTPHLCPTWSIVLCYQEHRAA